MAAETPNSRFDVTSQLESISKVPPEAKKWQEVWDIAIGTVNNPDAMRAGAEHLSSLNQAENNITSCLNNPSATSEQIALLQDFKNNTLPTLSPQELSKFNQECKVQVAGPALFLAVAVVCALVVSGTFYASGSDSRKAEALAKTKALADKVIASSDQDFESRFKNLYAENYDDFKSAVDARTASMKAKVASNPSQENKKAYEEAVKVAIKQEQDIRDPFWKLN